MVEKGQGNSCENIDLCMDADYCFLEARCSHRAFHSSLNFIRSSSLIFIHVSRSWGGRPTVPPRGPKRNGPTRSLDNTNKPTACQYESGARLNTDGTMPFHNTITMPPNTNAAVARRSGMNTIFLVQRCVMAVRSIDW